MSGKLCGVSRQVVSSIEGGDYHPSVVLALWRAQFSGETVERLFNWGMMYNEGL